MVCDLIEKRRVSQLISFSVNRRMSNTTREGAYATE